jgi:hypothetical protein
MRRKKTMSVREFMNGEFKKPKKRPTKINSFVYVNPAAFIDPTVCTVAGIILLIAITEKVLARNEHFEAMRIIQIIMDVALPAGGISALLFFLLEVL